MKLRNTLGGLAATLSIALTLVATPAATAATPIPASAPAFVAPTAVNKAGRGTQFKEAVNPPSGTFAVIATGTFRKGYSNWDRAMRQAGPVNLNSPDVVHLRDMKMVTGTTGGYTYIVPSKGSTVTAELFYFKNSKKAAVEKRLDQAESVGKGRYNWYKKSWSTNSSRIPPYLPYNSLKTLTYVPAKTPSLKGTDIKGAVCTIRGGDFKNIANKAGVITKASRDKNCKK
ncbi:gamma-glutamylcyclotransferase [Paeniglutamicibacter sp. R2-26]|uniref:gamma-glutamylcyclotransferase n=1 Tax=Paeniglutamicibacter sp. R2-26 TaxID=3144417 RepID=UPI003EE59C04